MASRRVVVAREPFGSMWPEGEALAASHWQEVESEAPPQRKFNPDAVALNQYSCRNLLVAITAREAGKLIGYYTWTISGDLESKGLVVANQAAWYLSPGYPKVAVRMFERSVAELKLASVKCIYPHHRLIGRGRHIGKFFTRRGAVPSQVNYTLWIGDTDA
jgi:hypothetical protein